MSGHAGTPAECWKNRNADYAGISVAAKNRMMHGIMQEAVDAAEREEIQVARATEANTNQTEFIGQPLHFGRTPPKEKELFDDCMEALRETPKDEHWCALESLCNSHSDLVHAFPKLAFILQSYYNRWKASQELEDCAQVEFWKRSFHSTPCDSWVTCRLEELGLPETEKSDGEDRIFY